MQTKEKESLTLAYKQYSNQMKIRRLRPLRIRPRKPVMMRTKGTKETDNRQE